MYEIWSLDLVTWEGTFFSAFTNRGNKTPFLSLHWIITCPCACRYVGIGSLCYFTTVWCFQCLSGHCTADVIGLHRAHEDIECSCLASVLCVDPITQPVHRPAAVLPVKLKGM